jgi:hypothetical protein
VGLHRERDLGLHKLDGNLVSIHSVEENWLIWKIYSSIQWFGFSDSIEEGTWRWTDGSKNDITPPWHTLALNQANGNQDCGVLSWSVEQPGGEIFNVQHIHLTLQHTNYLLRGFVMLKVLVTNATTLIV